MRSIEAAQAGRRRVLVVDEEAIVLDFIATVLTRAGYGVLAARSCDEALFLFHCHAPELAIMVFDIATLQTRMGAAQFIDSLPTLNPRIPVIFLSGLGEYEVPETLTHNFPVMRKPFHSGDLHIRITTLALPHTAA